MLGGLWCTTSYWVGLGLLLHVWWVAVYYSMFVGFSVYYFMYVGVVVHYFMFGGLWLFTVRRSVSQCGGCSVLHVWWVVVYYFMFVGFSVYYFMSVWVVVYYFMFGGL